MFSIKKFRLELLVSALAATFFVFDYAAAETFKEGATVISIEGAYFHPRRQDFRDLYGKGFQAIGARVDSRLRSTSWISFKGRFVKMSEYDEFNFMNASVAVLFKKTVEQESNIYLYGALGPGFDYRRINYHVQTGSGFYSDSTLSQSEWSPSIIVEAGLDLWLTTGIKFSPQVDFTYFPFGDPTTGDFGDTGGFYLGLGIGFKI